MYSIDICVHACLFLVSYILASSLPTNTNAVVLTSQACDLKDVLLRIHFRAQDAVAADAAATTECGSGGGAAEEAARRNISALERLGRFPHICMPCLLIREAGCLLPPDAVVVLATSAS